jgi:hypothetical protein
MTAVTRCQSCDSPDLELVVSLGLLPLVNAYRTAAELTQPQTFYPHDMLFCERCGLAQLGFVASPEEVFPKSYPYTSSTTKALRDNFADLFTQVKARIDLKASDLAIDIGGNDGNLLSNFVGTCRVLNVTPEDIGQLGEGRGVPHFQDYWDGATAAAVENAFGKARAITATNVFAHVPDLHGFLEACLSLLTPDGLLVLECQYLGDLLEGVQFDHIYAEHQRYLSVRAVENMLAPHGLTIDGIQRVATHGGSVRYYVSRGGKAGAGDPVDCGPGTRKLFAERAARSRLDFWEAIATRGGTCVGISAPSRAGTLINFYGIDHHVMPYIVETAGSHKIGKFMPGTSIPVVDEPRLFEQPEANALLLAHHISGELMPKLRSKGFAGRFLVPLPATEVFE